MKPQIYLGVFLVALSTLMYEILLPRIFSVTMFYHFAFMAISIAMFGMTVGAVIVHLRPATFCEERAFEHLARSAWWFAVTTVVTFLLYLQIPFRDDGSLASAASLLVSYALIATPFVLCGITISVALTRFPSHVGKLYAADLAGAAGGCILIIGVLEVTDAPTAVIAIAALGAAGAYCLSRATSHRRLQTLTAISAVALALAACGHTWLVREGEPIVRIIHRALPGLDAVYQRWNAYSFIEVSKLPEDNAPFTWGSSTRMPKDLRVEQYGLSIDIKAGTTITRFDGDTAPLAFLRYDVTNVAHYLRDQADVCVIGVGGGRDILTALHFGQKSVLGIELNPAIIDALTEDFGEFAGHLDRHPQVELVVDEARSYLTRSDARFDIVQVSLIDTFAATSAGAFVLAENSLYTVEAWEVFLSKLAPEGIFSVSRYYFNDRPAEAYRVVSLATEALARRGVSDPRSHLAMVRNRTNSIFAAGSSVATLLVSNAPLSDDSLRRLEETADRLAFAVVFSPRVAGDEVIQAIVDGEDRDAFYKNYELDLAAPTDDRPFFFQMLRLRDVLDPSTWNEKDVNWKNLKAVLVLVVLLAVVFVLTLGCIIIPLALRWRQQDRSDSPRFLFLFSAIGMGFMFVEIAWMQRFLVFLGQPIYSLSVVLFTLLCFGGVGSWASERMRLPATDRSAVAVFAAVVVVLTVFGLATPMVVDAFSGSSTPVRITVAACILAPMGLAMGVPFPACMRLASQQAPGLLAWLWGINGATSVLCSVFAAAVALTVGITACFWAGVGCYAAALLVCVWRAQRGKTPLPQTNASAF
ncbi:MAG: class I SAM-dependent methyltransferase [Myxococcales bacterium]|nr:class I SAM-dependent methyltransferase [Myxococcales bacterium]